MTDEKRKRRAEDSNVEYVKEHICNKDGNKSFVFISYKSDDWEVALKDVVYRLVHDYGLNVYFDGDFDVHNNSWLEQFPENMEDPKCKGVLFFLDNKYATSYATLLELMYSQTIMDDDGEVRKLPLIPVNLERLRVVKEEEDGDTTLGKNIFEDGSTNLNAEKEKAFLDKMLKDTEVIKEAIKSKYEKKGLSKRLCNTMMRQIIKGIQENTYEKGGNLSNIVGSIKDSCGEEVFTLTIGGPILPPPRPTPANRISLKDFLKQYNNNTFKKTTYQKLKLVGNGEYAKYGTDFYNSTYELTWAFVKKLLEKRGEEYIFFVNGKNQGVKNPPFIDAEEHQRRKERGDSIKYRVLDVSGLENYSMCRHFSIYDWIAGVLKRRIQELGLPLEEFSFEYVTGNAGNSAEVDELPDRSVGEEEPDNGESTGRKTDISEGGDITEPVRISGEGGEITGPVTVTGEKGGDTVERIEGRYPLQEFLKKYNNKTFQTKSCRRISLVGTDECEKYSVRGYESARNMVFDFAMKRIDESGMRYIEQVNASWTSKNPIFITTEEHSERKARGESVTYKEVTSGAVSGYSMCSHYSEYDWLRNSLMKQLNALKLPIEKFYLELEGERVENEKETQIIL